jgi:general secretion pathway protein D
LPRFRLRQVTTSAIVWDGQTIVLGGLLSEDVARFKDKVPVLGDLPFVGRLFRSESAQTRKKNLVIFVTPRIIDPAGNPAHSEDEMPFRQERFPSQTEEFPTQ